MRGFAPAQDVTPMPTTPGIQTSGGPPGLNRRANRHHAPLSPSTYADEGLLGCFEAVRLTGSPGEGNAIRTFLVRTKHQELRSYDKVGLVAGISLPSWPVSSPSNSSYVLVRSRPQR